MVNADDLLMLMDPQGSGKYIRYDEAVSTFDSRYGLREYGEIWVHDVDVGITLAAQDTWYQVTAWSNTVTSFSYDGHNGEANGVTPDASNDHLTILTTGIYMVHWWVSCYSGATNEFHLQMRRNNNSKGFPNTSGFRTTSTASAVGHVAGGGLCALNANDTIELWVERKDGGAVSKTLTIRAATLAVFLMQ